MAPRLELQTLLVSLLGSDNVYFQPPETLKMSYPAIVYKRDNVDTIHADNHPYKHKKRYQVTVIDRDPDSDIPNRIRDLPLTSYNRFFTNDGLNHDVFTIFF